MSVANKQQEYIPLRWCEKERRVIIEGADEDRFSVTVEDAIEACRVYERENRAAFRKQFHELLDLLGEWCHQRRAKIAKAFLTVRDAGLLFLLVTKGKSYNTDFEQNLTSLDLEIAHTSSFSQIRLSVQALPLCNRHNFESFCNPETTLEYTGLNAK